MNPLLALRAGPFGPRSQRIVSLAVIVALIISACGDDGDDSGAAEPAGLTTTTATPASSTTVPVAPTTTLARPPDFPTVAPAAVGFDDAAISGAVEVAEGASSNCLIVARDGQVAHEQYWNGSDAETNQPVFSATKTVTAVLVGIAVDQGLLSLDGPASTYLTEWVGTPSEAVTIRELLNNTSGRYQDLSTDYIEMSAAPDRSAYALGLDQQHDPGTVWVYNNAAIQTLEEVLERATGTDVGDFAAGNLLDPLAMSVEFERDEAGNPGTYTSLQAGCRDMLAFGQLLLDDGRWGGEQIVSGDYLATARQSGSDLNAAYGYLLWRNAAAGTAWSHPSPAVDTSGAARPDAPPNAFAAMGAGQQITLVIPETKTVVVRLGPAEVPAEEWRPNFSIINALAGAVS